MCVTQKRDAHPAVYSAISVTLTSGTITATLPFNGDDVRRSELNGPYTLTNLTITDQQNGGVPAIWQAANVYITGAYNSAKFAASCFVLSATANPISGGSINANSVPDCNGGLQYTLGTVVTLTAIANPGSSFIGWSGDASGTTNPILVTIDADKTIRANFNAHNYLPFITK